MNRETNEALDELLRAAQASWAECERLAGAAPSDAAPVPERASAHVAFINAAQALGQFAAIALDATETLEVHTLRIPGPGLVPCGGWITR
jgi:hypothetical protein